MRTTRALSFVKHLAVVVGLVLALPAAALARPNYFEAFTSYYGFTPGDDLYACGVCHLRWQGTGARNPYGTAVEQQLYIGAKPIIDAIRDVENEDTDLDGFTNVEELTVYGTLPGFSCDNYTIALNSPANFQSLITPLVPTCLEAFDLRVTPIEITLLTKVGTTDEFVIDLVNNGTDSPITVSSYDLLNAPATMSLSGPPLPLVIPVGGASSVTVSFSPTASILVEAAVRISSDDPDEPQIDVPVGGLSFVPNLAPAAKRAACHKQVERRVEMLTRTYLKEWGTCFTDELRGVACDTGRRDQRIAQAEALLRASVGGSADKACAGAGLTPTLLGLPDQCGGGCGAITVNTLSHWADCLVCREQEATAAMLEATVGTAPPDLPPAALGRVQQGCTRNVVKGMQRAIGALQKKLAGCELANVTATTPVDCATQHASDVARLTARLGSAIERCRDTSGMAGCSFAPGGDPSCLATSATAVASDLVDAVFETE